MELRELRAILEKLSKVEGIDDETEVGTFYAECEKPFSMCEETAVSLFYADDGIPTILIGPDKS